MTHFSVNLSELRAGHQHVPLVGVEVQRAVKDPCYGCPYPLGKFVQECNDHAFHPFSQIFFHSFYPPFYQVCGHRDPGHNHVCRLFVNSCNLYPGRGHVCLFNSEMGLAQDSQCRVNAPLRGLRERLSRLRPLSRCPPVLAFLEYRSLSLSLSRPLSLSSRSQLRSRLRWSLLEDIVVGGNVQYGHMTSQLYFQMFTNAARRAAGPAGETINSK